MSKETRTNRSRRWIFRSMGGSDVILFGDRCARPSFCSQRQPHFPTKSGLKSPTSGPFCDRLCAVQKIDASGRLDLGSPYHRAICGSRRAHDSACACPRRLKPPLYGERRNAIRSSQKNTAATHRETRRTAATRPSSTRRCIQAAASCVHRAASRRTNRAET